LSTVDFEFDAEAVAAAYAADAPGYAARYADHIEANDFDRAVLSHLLAGVPNDGLVLDAGCGPAQAAAFAEARGLRAVGFDLTHAMLLEARARGRGALVQGDLRALPFASGSFDAAITWFSLLHLPTSAMPSALGDLRRVLRPRAPLIVSLHGARFGDSLEWSVYRAHELATLLRAAGFVEVIARTRPPAPGENAVPKVIASGVR
jgi:SAM-dependent methyltransferase